MSRDSEVGNRVIVIDPAQVLVMSRALNDALEVVGQGHWPRAALRLVAGVSQQPKVIRWPEHGRSGVWVVTYVA